MKLLVLVAILGCEVGTSFGQATFGSIIGTVTDTTGAVIAGARVTVTNTLQGVTFETSTNSSGNYTQTHLATGSYSVNVAAPGFKTVIQQGVHVNVDTATRIDVTVQPGNTTETVNVNVAAPLIETDNANVSTTLTAREVAELPTFNRNFTSLELTVPGNAVDPFNQGGASENPQGGTQIDTNGQMFSARNFMIDGTDNNDIVIGVIIVNPAIDSVGEFKFTTLNYDAQYAQAGTAVIQVETKSGTNELHGSAFEFLQNNIFEARDPFTQSTGPLPGLHWNQFGGSLGGPIKRNKIFFFGDYQGTRQHIGTSVLTFVPTEAERQGDFSAFGTPIYDPNTGSSDGTGRTQFADPTRATPSNPGGLNIIPRNRITSQATNLLNYLPMPNLQPSSPFAPNYNTSSAEVFNSDQFDVRVDSYTSDRLRLFGRYTYARFNVTAPAAFGFAGGPPMSGLAFAGNASALNQNGVGGLNYSFTSTLLTDFRMGITRYRANVYPGDYGTSAAQQAGLPGLNIPGRIDTSGLPESIVSGNGGFLEGFGNENNGCNCPLLQVETSLQWVNNWTKVSGNHTVKWGADIRRAQNLRTPSCEHRSGVMSFSPSVTGTAENSNSGLSPASFLLGLPSVFERDAQVITNPTDLQNRMFYYVQDIWRATNKLTLNYGLRWDTWFPDSSTTKAVGGRYNVTDNYVRIPGVGGIPLTGGVNTQWHNLSPRLGIAWAPNLKTVIRAGVGISYFQGTYGLTFNNIANGWPTLVTQYVAPANPFQPAISMVTGPPAAVFPTIPPSGLLQCPNGISCLYIPTNLPYPYVYAYSLSVEREVSRSTTVSLSYVGNIGRHLNGYYNSNPAIPGPGDFNPRRPLYAPYGLTQYIPCGCDVYNSNYNALQVKAERHMTGNLSFIASYTWSKAMDDGASDFGSATNQVDHKADYGPADFNQTNVFTLAHIYILPFGSGQKWLANVHGFTKQLVSGWQWNGITALRTGFPFSPTLINTSSLNSDEGLRPDLVGNPYEGVPHNQFAWFNPNAYAVPALYQFGDARRNSLVGPNSVQTDWSLLKNFDLTERFKLQFRWEVFNAINRVNLAQPQSAIDSGIAGQIFDVGSPMRRMQFGLRLAW
jgi:Carboxypeptidase regulatory-like domain